MAVGAAFRAAVQWIFSATAKWKSQSLCLFPSHLYLQINPPPSRFSATGANASAMLPPSIEPPCALA
jgi:hypothetical protein